MSPFSYSLSPMSGDAGEIVLRPLFQLKDGSLAAVELSFVNPFASDWSKLKAAAGDILLKARALIAPAGFVCVSMGMRELAASHYPEAMARHCQTIGADPAGICLFFTDTLCHGLGIDALDQLLRFKRFGFRLGLDIEDLTSMPGLFVEKLPVDVLRLGPLETLALAEDSESASLVRDFIRYCDNLLMLPAAKGLQSLGQLGILREMGIRLGQGPLFSTPAPSAPMV